MCLAWLDTPYGSGPPLHFLMVTSFCGLPARKAAMLAAVVSMRRCRAASVVQAMWGVIRQFGAERSGLSGRIGSLETTSTAAPAIWPIRSASARSSPPRDRPVTC